MTTLDAPDDATAPMPASPPTAAAAAAPAATTGPYPSSSSPCGRLPPPPGPPLAAFKTPPPPPPPSSSDMHQHWQQQDHQQQHDESARGMVLGNEPLLRHVLTHFLGLGDQLLRVRGVSRGWAEIVATQPAVVVAPLLQIPTAGNNNARTVPQPAAIARFLAAARGCFGSGGGREGGSSKEGEGVSAVAVVDLRGALVEDADVAATVAAFGPTLRELWLDNCPRLTDAALTDSLPYCEALEVLSLRGCRGVEGGFQTSILPPEPGPVSLDGKPNRPAAPAPAIPRTENDAAPAAAAATPADASTDPPSSSPPEPQQPPAPLFLRLRLLDLSFTPAGRHGLRTLGAAGLVACYSNLRLTKRFNPKPGREEWCRVASPMMARKYYYKRAESMAAAVLDGVEPARAMPRVRFEGTPAVFELAKSYPQSAELQRLLHDFQGAVNHNDLAAARAALDEARGLPPLSVLAPRNFEVDLIDRDPLDLPLPYVDTGPVVAGRPAGDRAAAAMAVSPLAVLLEGPFTEYHVSALMLAAYSGHEEIVKLLLEYGADVGARAKGGGTALHIACRVGQAGIARLLLGKGADPRARTQNGSTPLHTCVSHRGTPEIARLLLEYDASSSTNPKSPQRWGTPHVDDASLDGTTPLHIAAQRGALEMATLLLSPPYHADPTLRNAHGLTPLTYAAHYGHTAVAALLLQWRRRPPTNPTNPNRPQQHQCPQAMVIPDCPDASGAFAIHHAAQGGHSGVLELLLLQSSSSSVSTEVGSDGAAGPVSSATAASVEGGRGRRRFDVEARTANGFRTALQLAAERGHAGCVALLLKHGADPHPQETLPPPSATNTQPAPPASPASSSSPPLSPTTNDTNNSNPLTSTPDDRARHSPLYLAARNGHAAVVQALLAVQAASVTGDDCLVRAWKGRKGLGNVERRSALMVAARKGRVEVVRLLLDAALARAPPALLLTATAVGSGAAAATTAATAAARGVAAGMMPFWEAVGLVDAEGHNPLHVAAEHGHLALLQALLQDYCLPSDKKETEPTTTTATSLAASLASLSLSTDHTDTTSNQSKAAEPEPPATAPNDTQQQPNTNIFTAPGEAAATAAITNESVAQPNIFTVLGTGNRWQRVLRVDAPTRRGQTALSYATWKGRLPIVEALLAAGADANAANSSGRTALQNASHKGHLQVACVLLRAGARVDDAARDHYTALHNAVLKGHLEVAQLLVEEGGADMDARTGKGNAALHLACQSGDLPMVALLLTLGAPLDPRNHEQGTPLHGACWKGKVAIVQTLLDAGADVLALTSDGRSCLHLACQAGHAPVVAALLRHAAFRAKLHTPTTTTITAAGSDDSDSSSGSDGDSHDPLARLLNGRAHPATRGLTPLMLAAGCLDSAETAAEIAREVLAFGAGKVDLGARDAEGRTAYALACARFGRAAPVCVRLLAAVVEKEGKGKGGGVGGVSGAGELD